MILAAAEKVHGPHIDWAAFSPIVALLAGSIVVLVIGLLRARVVREHVVPAAALVVLGAALGLSIWRWDDPESIIGTVAGSTSSLRPRAAPRSRRRRTSAR